MVLRKIAFVHLVVFEQKKRILFGPDNLRTDKLMNKTKKCYNTQNINKKFRIKPVRGCLKKFYNNS